MHRNEEHFQRRESLWIDSLVFQKNKKYELNIVSVQDAPEITTERKIYTFYIERSINRMT